jgi:hypothetical protein
VVNQILQHLQNVGVTVFAKKFMLAAPNAAIQIVRQKCMEP